MRPGDKVLGVSNPTDGRIHLCATQGQDGTIAVNILNTDDALEFPLQIGEYVANVSMPANSVKTIIVKL
jgi:hypothetical protein